MFFQAQTLFWNAYPAVLIGISFLIGIGCTLFDLPWWVALSFFGYLIFLRKNAAACILPAAYLYAFILFGSLPILEKPKQVAGYLTISTVKINQTPFAQNLIYKGTLFVDKQPLPCTISVQENQRLSASCDYRVTGTLMQREAYDYLLKAHTWEAVPNTWSLAELRFIAKGKLKTFLHTHLTLPRTATLLNSLATGDVEDRLLRYEFSRLGLQHILAISGFHFGVLISFFSLLFGFFPNHIRWLAMICLTTLYYLFIGDSPAVQRAWIIVTLFLLAKLIKRPTTPVNLLGSALLIELICNPLVAANLGFQFSFGSCFGILLLYRPIDDALKRFLPSRPIREATRLSFFQGIVYLFCRSTRSAISLMAAVNLTLLPLLFHHFGKFPLLSLLYNLFFPFFISMALFLFLAALLLSPLSTVLSTLLFTCLDHLAYHLLDLVSYPPLLLDYSIYIHEFPSIFIPIYLFLLLQFSIKSFTTCINTSLRL